MGLRGQFQPQTDLVQPPKAHTVSGNAPDVNMHKWGHSPMPTSLFVPQVHPSIKEIFQGEELLHVEEVGVAERLGQQLVIHS